MAAVSEQHPGVPAEASTRPEPGSSHGGPTDLVLEGGGVKGIGLVGAISVLEEAGYVFRRVAGTSAGSIVGALVAAGMSAAEMREVMEQLDYRRFRDPTRLTRIPLVGIALSVMLRQGAYRGDYVESFVAEQLASKGVTTFADLREPDPGSSLPPDERFKLIVHVSDVSRTQLLRLPWDYHPDFGIDPDTVSVAAAVRASASIPLFFTPKKLQPRGDGAANEESWLVDGGLLSNFPIDVFDRRDGKPDRWPTIGIKLSARRPPASVQHNVSGTISLVRAMVHTMTSWYDQRHIDNEATVARTIFVDTTGIRSTDFAIDRRTQQRLFDNGRAAATKWMEESTAT
jgi:NTE family protein